MKKLLLAALLAVQVLIGYAFVMDPGQAPKTVLAHAFTPTEVKQQMEQEKKQLVYDAAENIAARVLRRHGCSDEFAEALGHAAVDERLDARVVAAVAYVESTCNPSAHSPDAIGLMQVSPKSHPEYEKAKLWNPLYNVKAGTHILAGYIRKAGLEEGLHRYNGLGVGCAACDAEYVPKVLRAAGYAT